MSHAILGIYLHFRKFIFYMKLNFNLTSGIFLFKSVKPRIWSWINAALRCYGHQARVPSCYTNWLGQLCPRGADSLASPGAGSANSSSLWVAPENYQQAPVCLCLSRHRIGILIFASKTVAALRINMGPDVQSGEYTVYYPKSVSLVQAGCHHPIRHTEMRCCWQPASSWRTLQTPLRLLTGSEERAVSSSSFLLLMQCLGDLHHVLGFVFFSFFLMQNWERGKNL